MTERVEDLSQNPSALPNVVFHQSCVRRVGDSILNKYEQVSVTGNHLIAYLGFKF